MSTASTQCIATSGASRVGSRSTSWRSTRGGLPHNPMVNAGGIMTTSLIRPDLDLADRFDHVAATWQRLAGGRRVGFNNAVYLSERQTADRNFALGYSMRENGAFPPGVDLQQTLEFYFQNCSIELDTEMLAIAAASLANAGVCPLTEDPVFSPATVQSCLSANVLLRHVRLLRRIRIHYRPAGQERRIRRDDGHHPRPYGNRRLVAAPGRARQFGTRRRVLPQARRRIQRPRLRLPGQRPGPQHQTRSRRKKNQSQIEGVVALCWAASQGDINEVRGLLATGIDPGTPDYDGRTALHLAAAEGQTEIVSYLLATGTNAEPVDRWGGTPLSDAQANDHSHIVELLQHALNQIPTEAEA
jgi:glutaminase